MQHLPVNNSGLRLTAGSLSVLLLCAVSLVAWGSAWCLMGGSLSGCAPATVVGIVSPDQIISRTLRIRNESHQYVVVRVTAPDGEPLVTPTVCPGGHVYCEMATQFGDLCPATLRFEVAGYSRAHSELSPLVDETMNADPFAAFAVELTAVRDFGCQADPSLISLDTMIECRILDADPDAGALGFQVGFLPAQQQLGVELADPPAPSPPEMFALRGEVINVAGEPLAGIEIHLPQLGASLFTDAQGRFDMLRPVGSYQLRPTSEGFSFSPVLQEFTHYGPDQVAVQFIALPD